MWKLENYPYIYNKQDYLILENGVSIGRKTGIRVHVNGNSSVIDRYNGYKRDLNYARKRITHYMVDKKLCLRVIKEDIRTNNVWQKPTEVTVEVFGADKDKSTIENNIGHLLRNLFDKFGFNKNNVVFSGESYKLNKNRIINIATQDYRKLAKVIETINDTLIPLGHVLKDYCFQNVVSVERDGTGLGHWDLVRLGFEGDMYYLNNIGCGDNKKTILLYLQRFVDRRINNINKLKPINYVCYYNDNQKYLAEMFGYLADAKVFKDNGRFFTGCKVRYLKDRGKLLYVGDLGKKESIRHFCSKWLV